MPDANSLDVGDSFSAEMWIRRSATAKSVPLMSKRGNGFQLVLMPATSGNQVYLRKADVTSVARSSAGIAADGRYHHLVVTKNGPNSAKFYVDGVQGAVQISGAQAIQSTTQPLDFGGAASHAVDFDEFALYPRALTSAEVTEHYQAAVPPAV